VSVLPNYNGDPQLQQMFRLIDEQLSQIRSIHGQFTPSGAVNISHPLTTSPVVTTGLAPGTNVGERNFVVSAETESFSTAGAGFAAVINSITSAPVQVDIQTTGRPVVIMVIPVSRDNRQANSYTSVNQGSLQVIRGSLVTDLMVGWGTVELAATSSNGTGSAYIFSDIPPAGTFRYKLWAAGGAGGTLHLIHYQMVAFEL
jgi:hypothetical protein